MPSTGNPCKRVKITLAADFFCSYRSDLEPEDINLDRTWIISRRTHWCSSSRELHDCSSDIYRDNPRILDDKGCPRFIVHATCRRVKTNWLRQVLYSAVRETTAGMPHHRRALICPVRREYVTLSRNLLSTLFVVLDCLPMHTFNVDPMQCESGVHIYHCPLAQLSTHYLKVARLHMSNPRRS